MALPAIDAISPLLESRELSTLAQLLFRCSCAGDGSSDAEMGDGYCACMGTRGSCGTKGWLSAWVGVGLGVEGIAVLTAAATTLMGCTVACGWSRAMGSTALLLDLGRCAVPSPGVETARCSSGVASGGVWKAVAGRCG